MKKLITLLAHCLIATVALAQVPSMQWQKALGGTGSDYGQSIQQTNDGGYIMTGFTNSIADDVSGNHGGFDIWVVKLSSTNSLQWQKALGGTASDVATSIQTTSDGGYIIAGYTNSNNGDVSGNHGGNADAWIVKLSSTGSLQWQKCLGGTDEDQARSIQPTADGGYIIAGLTNSNNGDVSGNHGGYADAWIVKLSSTGNLQWQKCLGGTGVEYAYSIQPTADGGSIMAGNTASNNGDVSGNHEGGGTDAWVVKLSSTGNLQWQKCLGGTLSDYAYSIQLTAEGGYIMAGYIFSTDGDVSGNHGNIDAWVVKLSSTGSLEWQKALGGTVSDYAYSIQPTVDGGYIMSGYTFSSDGDVTGNHGGADAWVVKLLNTGNLQWQKCLGGTFNEIAYSFQPTDDQGYIMAGQTNSIDGDIVGNHGNFDAWIVKLGPDLATSNFNKQELTLYPNPTNGILNIENLTGVTIETITIMDLTRKKILQQSGNSNQINVQNLQQGLYLLELFYDGGKQIEKFIKE